MRTTAIAALVALAVRAMTAPGAAQETVQAPAEACASAVRSAATLNGSALFAGAKSCAQAERKEDANFLILVSQIEHCPTYEELGRLNARMEAAARDIPELPPPEDTTPYARLNEPDPEMTTRQVAVGFNGPPEAGTYLFRSEAELRSSWLARALPEPDLAALWQEQISTLNGW